MHDARTRLGRFRVWAFRRRWNERFDKLVAKAEGVAILFGGIDSPVSQAIVPLVNACAVHGRVGCGDEYHPQRRQSKLRFPSFSGRRGSMNFFTTKAL